MLNHSTRVSKRNTSGRETSLSRSRTQRPTVLFAFDDYNKHRIHSAIGYMTPSEYGDAVRRAMIK